ncbi:hypothetical protein IE4803_PB00015 (plasmid) [Rhizobium etli bv. phaseoli str. IE4803]|nr:hypothetical protein IE4803_PB00015 [Rhizobium etli bv. phaseoli str. IE4803]
MEEQLANDQENIKAVLKAAKVQIDDTLKRVDSLDASEMNALKGAVHNVAAFVDFNSGCGKAKLNNLSGVDLMSKLNG